MNGRMEPTTAPKRTTERPSTVGKGEKKGAMISLSENRQGQRGAERATQAGGPAEKGGRHEEGVLKGRRRERKGSRGEGSQLGFFPQGELSRSARRGAELRRAVGPELLNTIFCS